MKKQEKRQTIKEKRKKQRQRLLFRRALAIVALAILLLLFGAVISKRGIAFSADIKLENAVRSDDVAVTATSTRVSELCVKVGDSMKTKVSSSHKAKSKTESQAKRKASQVKKTKKASQESVAAKIDPEKLIWLGWSCFESGDAGFAQVGGDSGHAYGKFQLDDRHGLAGFLKYCQDYDGEKFSCFSRYIRVDGDGKLYLTGLETLPEDWNWLCYTEAETFFWLQTEYVILTYYEPAKQRLLESKSIDLDQYGPVLKGTVLSCSIRNGSYLENLSSITDTYYAGISEQEWLERTYAAQAVLHPDQTERWAVNQKNAALEVLAVYTGLKQLNWSELEPYDFEEVIK